MARSEQTFKSPKAWAAEVVDKARGLYRDLELKIEYLPIDSLQPAKRRARKHKNEQVEQVAESIKALGLYRPILHDSENHILSGHCIWEAAKLLRFEKVPTVALHHLSEAQRRALPIADNQLALLSEWDPGILGEEFEFLTTCEIEFAPEVTGFSSAEIDILIEGEEDAEGNIDDETPEPEETLVSRLGDLWLLGEHRLLCGDARAEESYRTLFVDDKAAMAFVDLPYNVPINGHVMGSGAIKHDEFVMASGEMSEAEFRRFIADIVKRLILFSEEGSLHYLCMDWRHISDLIESARPHYGAFANLCVWNKSNGGMGSLYRSKHELIAVFKVGSAPITNNVELGKYGRNRTNVWDYAGVNTFRRGRLEELSLHPSVKSCVMVVDAIRDSTRRGQIVLDVCGGSGTMIIAAAKCGRIARVMELDPKYVDVATRRWEQWSGVEAIHAETGLTFAETAAQREEEQASSLAKSSEAQPSEIDISREPSRGEAPPMRIRHRARPTPRAAA